MKMSISLGIIIAVLVVVIVFVVSNLMLFSDSKNWIENEGKILRSAVVKAKMTSSSTTTHGTWETAYDTDILYEYSYYGVTHQGNAVYAGLGITTKSRADAEEIVNAYPPGSMVTLFVNPKKPSESSLRSSQGIASKLVVVFAVMFILIGLIVSGVYFFLKKTGV